MANPFDQYISQNLGPQDSVEGSPIVSAQSLIRAVVVYHMTSTNLYLLSPLEGPDVLNGIFIGCDMTSMSPFGGGTSGGRLLFPGSRVFVIAVSFASMTNSTVSNAVYPIVAIDNEIPAGDTSYYPLWRILPLIGSDDIAGYKIDKDLFGLTGISQTDRLRGKPNDLAPGDWMVGTPLKGTLFAGGGRVGMEAGPLSGIHMYTAGDTIVFNKGLRYIADQPWERYFSMLSTDGLSIKGEMISDSVDEAMGNDYGSGQTFRPNPGSDLDVPNGKEVTLNSSSPRWYEMNYKGYPVGGKIFQRVVESRKNGVKQPGIFSFQGVDGFRIEGGAHSFTFTRSADLPLLEMLRELDNTEQEQNESFTPEPDVTDRDFGEYASQYADLMYELMKQKFVERYWARQKANNKDWKAFNAAEVAEQLGRSINQKLSPLPDEEPAYKNNNIEVKDPIDEDVMMKLAKLESYIHLSPTGAVIISDDTGSEIRMEGGHITISPAVDIKLQPGRDMSATIPRFASIFSGKRLDLTSDKDEVTIHADKNVTVSGEGFVTIESRNKNTTTSSDPDKRGEGGGVIIRSATDANIISHSIRLTLQNANDDSQTGQKAVSDGMLIIDASDSPIFMNGRLVATGYSFSFIADNKAALSLSNGIVAVASSTQNFLANSYIFGGESFKFKYMDPRTRTEKEMTFKPDRSSKKTPSMFLDGSFVARKAVNAESVSGSNAVFSTLHSFNSKETESLYVPPQIKTKYAKAINTYATMPSNFNINISGESELKNWLSANASNPALSAYGSKRMGIYYPNTDGYKQSNCFWVASKWQRNMTGGNTWAPKEIKDVDNKDMLPYPGLDSWTKDNFAVTWNEDGELDAKPLSGNWTINCQQK